MAENSSKRHEAYDLLWIAKIVESYLLAKNGLRYLIENEKNRL